MLSHILAPWLARRGIHYGWAVVAVVFLTMLATAAAMGMPGVLLLPLKGEFGWDLGSISGALALRLMLFGLVAPFAAALLQRYGVRPVVGGALGLIVIGLWLATRMTALWQLWLTSGVMLGLSTGVTVAWTIPEIGAFSVKCSIAASALASFCSRSSACRSASSCFCAFSEMKSSTAFSSSFTMTSSPPFVDANWPCCIANCVSWYCNVSVASITAALERAIDLSSSVLMSTRC
jgi:hypothetical protein